MHDDETQPQEHGHSLLGAYGVLIVPPTDPAGGWLVSVGGWDVDVERYVTSGEGPIFETREEAMVEASRVIEWLQTADDDIDPVYAWERLQRARAAEERGDDAPRPWGRF